MISLVLLIKTESWSQSNLIWGASANLLPFLQKPSKVRFWADLGFEDTTTNDYWGGQDTCH